jgi:hypothetical protein
VGNDNRVLRRRKANIPCKMREEKNQPGNQQVVSDVKIEAFSQNCTDDPSPPDATGIKSGFALQVAMEESISKPKKSSIVLLNTPTTTVPRQS